jgi:hypothetical protein
MPDRTAVDALARFSTHPRQECATLASIGKPLRVEFCRMGHARRAAGLLNALALRQTPTHDKRTSAATAGRQWVVIAVPSVCPARDSPQIGQRKRRRRGTYGSKAMHHRQSRKPR